MKRIRGEMFILKIEKKGKNPVQEKDMSGETAVEKDKFTGLTDQFCLIYFHNERSIRTIDNYFKVKALIKQHVR